MVARKPRIVIIGAGMAGLTAANRLAQAHAPPASGSLFELVVVEASNRIGGRILSTEFGGNRVELGATWIHGIGGSPVHKIAERIGSLESDKPWERMDGFPDDSFVKAEGGLTVDPSLVHSISQLYKSLADVAQAKDDPSDDSKDAQIAREALRLAPRNEDERLSIGAFVRQALKSYWADQESISSTNYGNHNYSNGEAADAALPFNAWNRKLLEEGIFSIHENSERTYTSAGSLLELDFDAEKEYREFPGEQITVAKGYNTVLKSLASVLPAGTIQFGKKVEKIVWTNEDEICRETPVHLHFEDGSVMEAEHVIITVSLGVLKAGTGQGAAKGKCALFHPPLPSCKANAISKLGFGVVNKLFLQVGSLEDDVVYPYLHFIFSKFSRNKKSTPPSWLRKTVSLCPIYRTSNVLLAWFAGDEALELECLSDDEIIRGVSDALTSLGVRESDQGKENRISNGNKCRVEHGAEAKEKINGAFNGVLKSRWGFDPLFRGSYSYVAVGSSGQDIDTMAEPLPKRFAQNPSTVVPPLQLLFAGEATHRTHYSTTHGAYFSGLREANRLLQHYGWTSLEHL